jgi:peroxiredoxin
MRNLVILVSAVVVFLTGCGKDQSARPAPDFTLKTPDGQAVRLSEHMGKSVVLLDFSATWCPPCALAVPSLKKLHEKAAGKLVVIAVDVNEPVEAVLGYVRRMGIEHTVLLDPDGAVAREYGIEGFPTFVVIDLEGRVRYYGHDVSEAGDVIGKLLGG